jgi:hypothetical protein
MELQETRTTTAGIDRAWAALAGVTDFPKWTASMTRVVPMDSPALGVGRRFRITQPGLPPTVWRVSEVHEGESFTWEAHAPGIHTVAYHRLRANANGGTEITIGLVQTGALAGLLARLIGRRTRHYLTLEAAGLKAAAEA